MHKHCLCESATFGELFNLSEPKRVVRSNTVKGPPLDIRAFDDAQYYLFNFKSNPSTTGLRHHGYIKFKRPKRDQALTEIPCMVDCTCPDYRYRFAWTNKQRGAGRVGGGSLNQALNRAPRITNPGNRPGLCKHILALKNYIQGMMWELPKTGLKSSDDVLQGLVNYASKRWEQFPQQMAAAKARDARFAAVKALSRAGRPQPSPDQLPDIPATEEPEPQRPRVPYVSGEPEMPENVEQASKIKPPTLDIKPENNKRLESATLGVVDSLCIMKPLLEELNVIGRLIEDAEEQTPPTEGEAAHGDALSLLKSIDQGIRSLNQGFETLSVEIKGEKTEENPLGPEEDEDEKVDVDVEKAKVDAGAESNDVANLERELEKIGVPQA
jgi:hypothetical protein